MLNLVKQIKERQKFNAETLRARRKEARQAEEGTSHLLNVKLISERSF